MGVWDEYDKDEQEKGGFTVFKFLEVGDHLEGTFVGLERVKFQEDREPQFVPILTTESPTPVHLSSNVDLLRKLRELNAEPGDDLKITFTGTRPTKRGRMKVFEVLVTKIPQGT